MKTELIDILDETGNATGKRLPIDDLHAQELWHGVAHVWIYNKEGQLLLQRRHPDVKWGADKWDLTAGGHISAGETPLQGAIREAKEEIGLKLDPSSLELAGITSTVNVTPSTGRKHKTYEWNYIVEQDLDPAKLKLQADETTDLRWFDLDEFEKDIKDPERFKIYAPRKYETYELIINNLR
jgi:8-oxo-dGTP pyrophosphatase MutT (NUDIX family)